MTEIKNVKKIYGERTVLDIDYLNAEQGEALAVAGANGSGKSTLLKILAGIIPPTEGSVSRPNETLYLPQRAYAFNGTVLDNMLIGAKNQRRKAQELLEGFDLISLRDKRASSLSGGELQRLSLCRLFMRECKLLLLDEPTSSCDAISTDIVLSQIEKYRKENGCTLIMSTHSPAVAVHSAQKLIILNCGKPEAFGLADEIINDPPSVWTKKFIDRWKI